jgi:hypothetical protein
LVDDEPEPIEVVAVATDGRLTVIEGPLNVGEPVILGLTEVKSR